MGRADAATPRLNAHAPELDRAAVPAEAADTDRTKILCPVRRPGLVHRDRLLRRIALAADDVPLTLLTAPAGYGKTTVLSQWAIEDPRPFVWVHVDEADNDPVRLLRHIALALHRVHPLDGSVWRALGASHDSPATVALTRLLTAAAAMPTPWVMVLDDVHLLQDMPGPDVVVAFANGLPTGCDLVLAGRNRPGMRLSGLRSQGKCVEYGQRDLAFTAGEIGDLLASAGIPASEQIVANLLRRTEGWPAGVYLAALSMRGRVEPHAAASELAGSATHIFDYLREQVLQHESADTVRFLVRSAPLGQLSGPLCDAVLDTTGSAARLAEMAERNLFVEPQGDDLVWYRYHPLFAEMLLADLRRRDPAAEARAHQRAAAWYEQHDQPESSVSHALAAHDMALAARLVTAYGQRYVNTGRLNTVRNWLRPLANGALEAHPALAVMAGWIWALTSDAARAQECLRAAEHGAHSAATDPAVDDAAHEGRELIAGIARLRAALAPLGIEWMLTDARNALSMEKPGGLWYPMAAMLAGVAHALAGEPDEATSLLERAAYFGREHQRASASFALAQLALIFAEESDWSAAQERADEAFELVHTGKLGHYPSSVAVHVARAKIALRRRDIPLARHSAGRALRLYAERSPAAFPWLAAQMAIELGGILIGLEDHDAARLRLTEARRHLARLTTHGVLGHRHQRLADELARQDGGSSRSGSLTLTAAEMRVLQLLPTHLTLSEIADTLFLSRNTVKTQVAAVYGKLLASNRAEAVRAAKEFGLLD